MMKQNILSREKINLFIIATIAMFLISFPFFVYSQNSSPNTGITYECVTGTGDTAIYGNCTYTDFIRAIKRVTDWLIIFTLQFSVVVIVYAGFKYMISGDNASKRTEANKMLQKVALGIFFVVAAWLVVTLIANALLTDAVRRVTPVGP